MCFDAVERGELMAIASILSGFLLDKNGSVKISYSFERRRLVYHWSIRLHS